MRALLFVVAVPFLAAQSGSGGPRPPQLPRAEKARLSALLPNPAVLDARSAKPRAFYSADLYKYIDGGAEAYHQRGFVALVHREYRAAGTDLTVDIYDMGNAARAAAIFAAERPPDCASAPIASENCIDQGALTFRQQRYYIKLMAFGPPGATAALLEKAARSISARIASWRGARRVPPA